MRITSKGQVTIPQRIRERHGLRPGTKVEFVSQGTSVLLRPKARAAKPVDEWLQAATGAARGRLTTVQLMRLTRGEK
ncbi:MAG: AbrB/MazE/SpoVT family DNA-binding domain-containing protein [Opitutales bacterium]